MPFFEGGNDLMNIDEIKKILQLMQENDLAEFEMEKEGFRIALKKAQPAITSQVPIQQTLPQMQASMQQSAQVEKSSTEKEDKGKYHEIISPMVGTFYAAPTPDSEPFVKVGDEIHSDEVVCILEAMKVMNEIKSEVHGRVVDILVENAEPVEFGQLLFKIEVLP
jgi:acetyl-CoA carboxylase biotin carboxyl carrier protein